MSQGVSEHSNEQALQAHGISGACAAPSNCGSGQRRLARLMCVEGGQESRYEVIGSPVLRSAIDTRVY